MTIYLKNKHTLKIFEYEFKCSIGKKGLSKRKIEGDKKTPCGTFNLGPLYFRKDRIKNISTKLKKIIIKKNMGWCDDVNSKYYNKLINVQKKVSHENMFRKDKKYDLLIPIKFNYKKVKKNKGSCIFLHLTQNYNRTAGCIALKKNDFLIMLKLINKKTKIKIY
tara:strand:+ start:425 stop:916 length:492 start_codon:yes stop_codon:yes gene_type:complete